MRRILLTPTSVLPRSVETALEMVLVFPAIKYGHSGDPFLGAWLRLIPQPSLRCLEPPLIAQGLGFLALERSTWQKPGSLADHSPIITYAQRVSAILTACLVCTSTDLLGLRNSLPFAIGFRMLHDAWDHPHQPSNMEQQGGIQRWDCP